MTLRLNGSTSGYSEIDAPAIAGDQTFTLPGSGGIIQTVGTSLTLGTAQASTSGTSIDFTGIPSYVKRITVMFNGVSTNGTSSLLVQLGAGSVTTSGYTSGALAAQSTASSSAAATSSAGILAAVAITAATDLMSGYMQVLNVSGNGWMGAAVTGNSVGTRSTTGTGSVTLSGTLDRIRITTVNGTDTFDAGSINILYEG